MQKTGLSIKYTQANKTQLESKVSTRSLLFRTTGTSDEVYATLEYRRDIKLKETVASNWP